MSFPKWNKCCEERETVNQESRKPKELEIGNTHVLSSLKRGAFHTLISFGQGFEPAKQRPRPWRQSPDEFSKAKVTLGPCWKRTNTSSHLSHTYLCLSSALPEAGLLFDTITHCTCFHLKCPVSCAKEMFFWLSSMCVLFF